MFSPTKYWNIESYSYNDYKLDHMQSNVFGSNDISMKYERMKTNRIVPRKLELSEINKMDDEEELKRYEKEYDEFLEKKRQLLLLLSLDDIITEYIEIRDSISIRLENLIRKKKRNEFLNNAKKKIIEEENNINAINMAIHTQQSWLPQELRLKDEEIERGYIPLNNVKEFNCGCMSIEYYLGLSRYENYKPHGNIIRFKYCKSHTNVKMSLNYLVTELENIANTNNKNIGNINKNVKRSVSYKSLKR